MRTPTLTLLSLALSTAMASAQITTRASLSTSGAEPNDSCVRVVISGDGEVVSFHSFADNLVAGDTNTALDVFVRVLGTGVTERVSVDSSGVQGNNASTTARLDGGGDRVVFTSYATNLVGSDTNGVPDIFLHDRSDGTTIVVSVDSSGNDGNGASAEPDISLDGRYVVFQSEADNLAAGDTNGVLDVFRHDTLTGETIRVSVDSSGNEGNDVSFIGRVSEAGRWIAFHSDASNLVVGDTNGVRDVFVHDCDTGETIRVSTDSSGDQGNGWSQMPSISGDGQRVAFNAWASNLVTGDTNGDGDIFVKDLGTGVTTRVSVASDGTEADYSSSLPDIAQNGEVVTFQSFATNLVDTDTNGDDDVFVHSLVTSVTHRASVNSAGDEGNWDSEMPSIDAQGLHVAFQSLATNLESGDANGFRDAYVRQGLALYFPLDPSPSDPVSFTIYSEFDRPGDLALVLLSCSGTEGFELSGVTVPLSYDACTTLGLRLAFVLRGSFGNDHTARTPTVKWPDLPTGTTLYAAAITLGHGGVQHVTAPLTIVSR